MYLGAFESVKQLDARDWRNMSQSEKDEILKKYDLVYVNDYDTKTTYEYKKGVLTNTTYSIPQGTSGLWSWATETANTIVNQVVNSATQQIINKNNPPSQSLEIKKGFEMPEIPNWILPVGLVLIAGVFILPKLKRTI